MSEKFDAAREIEALKTLDTYEFLEETPIPEINALGVTMEHRKTGARVFLLLSDDTNKVFTIGFRTPSRDSTGVAHIVEHTTLCGSEKYPSKDPFVELVKGSLNTFLNAMTYPDKTIYPVASVNDADFRNLMDVYLDAVFHPNLYREEKIFRQEGWHFEAESADGPLTLNGVVYNEMKGAYSSVDGVMERAVNEVLFPGHPYAEESGGDPDFIPDLTYESYLDFHARYYHPSNSFIYLYGAMDYRDQLAYIDREYLSAYDRRPVDSAIPVPAPLTAPVERVFEYAVSENEPVDSAWYFSLNKRVGGELDPLYYNAFQALEYVLLEVPGAPLHKALIDAGVCEDVYGGYSYGVREPYFSVTAKNTSLDKKDLFLSTVRGTLSGLAENGLDRDMLKAAVNVAEFRAREADFGSYPKGLMYGIESFNSWLYDADPCMHLKFEEMFADLKKKIDEGFFEQLIRDALVGGEKEALVIMKPVAGLTARKDEELKEKLAGIKDGMTREEMEKVVRETKELKAYQSEPSSREDLMKIPLLKRSDIGREAEKPVFEERTEAGLPVVWSRVFTSGIAYVRLLFDIGSLSMEELSCMAFLRDTFSYIDTEEHSYADLATQVNMNSGGIGFGMDCYPDFTAPGKQTLVFSASGKALYEKTGFVLSAMREMLLTSKLSDTARLKEILAEVKAGLKDRLTSAGHTAAMSRAGSFLSMEAAFGDAIRGIAYYKFLERLAAGSGTAEGGEAPADDAGSGAAWDRFAERLSGLVRRIFTADNLRVHVTCDEEGYRAFASALRGFKETFPAAASRPDGADYAPSVRREAWETASLVNYVARAGNFRQHGFAYTGALRILKVLLSYDYLWNSVRVRGGAYGCMSAFGRSGNSSFVSYRDPKLLETDEVYDGIAEFAAQYEADEREMTKTIIGAISELDIPLTPVTKGLRGLSAFYSHVTAEDLQRERDEILDATDADIRALAPLLEAVLSDGAKCVVGNETQIRAHAEAFSQVRPLFGEQE